MASAAEIAMIEHYRKPVRRRVAAFKQEIVRLRKTEPSLLYREIATRIGCTERYVKNICSVMGLQAGRKPPPLRTGKAKYRAAIIALRKDRPELLYTEIASIVGCSLSTVCHVCANAGLKRVRRTFDPGFSQIVRMGRAAHAAGLTLQQIEAMANARHA